MRCAYCGNEMEQGYVKNPRGVIAWTPAGERANVLQSRAKEYQIPLGTTTKLGATTVETMYCPECGIFIMKK